VSGWVGLLAGLFGPKVSPSAVRAETFALGGRHLGEVLEGARIELSAPDVSPQKAALLRAVIRSL
jgi:hypothetical protein